MIRSSFSSSSSYSDTYDRALPPRATGSAQPRVLRNYISESYDEAYISLTIQADVTSFITGIRVIHCFYELHTGSIMSLHRTDFFYQKRFKRLISFVTTIVSYEVSQSRTYMQHQLMSAPIFTHYPAAYCPSKDHSTSSMNQSTIRLNRIVQM